MKSWIILGINTYSYEATEINCTVATTKEEALEKFNNLVKEYLKEYKDRFSELYNKADLSFEEYIQVAKEYDNNWAFGYEESKYEYKLTVEGELTATNGECDTEATIVRVFEASSDNLSFESVCMLDNVKDVDNLYNKLNN